MHGGRHGGPACADLGDCRGGCPLKKAGDKPKESSTPQSGGSSEGDAMTAEGEMQASGRGRGGGPEGEAAELYEPNASLAELKEKMAKGRPDGELPWPALPLSTLRWPPTVQPRPG